MPIEPAIEPTEWGFLDSLIGVGEFITKNADGEIVGVPRILMAAPTIYDVVFCGLDFAPGSASAMERWRSQKRTEALVAGVANFSWPSPLTGQENRSSIVQFTAGLGVATVGIAVPLITDAAILNAGPKNHILRLQVVNNSLPTLPMGLAAPATGNMPLRYLPGVTALSVPHGQIGELEVETDGNTIGYVRSARLLGDTVPPTTLMIDSARGSGLPITQLASNVFAPFMVDGEAMLLIHGRITGTGATLPPDRGWAYPTDADLNGVGGVLNGTVSALRVAVSTARPGGAGVVDGTNTMSNQQFLHASAWRGCLPTDYKTALSTGTTVVFASFSGVAPGGFVIYAVLVNSATSVSPEGGVGIDTAPVAQSGWNFRVVRVEPDEDGNVAPPNVTLGGAAACLIVAIRMEPN
jgi:hypothetical protein